MGNIGSPMRFPRPAGRVVAVSGAILGLSGLVVGVTGPLARPAAAYPSANVIVSGHGWGHGRGMGQWGALGYATSGWSWSQIVGHYYGSLTGGGSTTVGTLAQSNNPGASDTSTIKVDMTENDGFDLIVTSGSPFTVTGVGAPLPAHAGARFRLSVTGGVPSWFVDTSPAGGGCAGPWTQVASAASSPVAAPVTPAPFPSDGSLASEVLQLCTPSSGIISVRGSLVAMANSNNAARAVNELALGQYVADVTPSESPASWGAVNGGQGFQALEAQAVAVRSYVMSSLGGYGGYADICDSTACQEYPGIANENNGATSTDAATTGTANDVVLMPGGAVARTEYSASTGGYSAPGTFAAVADDGDAVCLPGACNPHHDWQVQIPVSAVQAAYPGIGTLESVDVTQRNGFGDFGGRVLSLTLVGSNANQVLSGDTFASVFSGYGMQSNWFSVLSEPSGGVSGYWVAGSDGGVFAYGAAGFHGSMGGKPLDKPVVGMAGTNDHGGYWEVASDGGIFSFGDAGFGGSMGGKPLDKPMVGMAAAPGGGYWTVASDGGIFSFGGAPFYGSMGGKPLAAPVVGIAATSDGRGYWLVASDGGIFCFGDASFQGSLPGAGVSAQAVTIMPTHTKLGYDIVTADGRVIPFGDAPEFGEPASSSPADAMVGGDVVTQ